MKVKRSLLKQTAASRVLLTIQSMRAILYWHTGSSRDRRCDMTIFQSSEQFYECVGELLTLASKDPLVGKKIAASGLIIQFRYTEPDAITTINARQTPSQPGAYVDVIHGACDLKPDVTMSMEADISHAFWHGKVNLLSALSSKQIVAEGPIIKIIKLLPAVQSLYAKYPEVLREKGFEDLIIK